MRLIPLQDRVIIREVEGKNRTKGGIWLPDTAVDRPEVGVVQAVGPAVREGLIEAGARVVFGKYAGADIEVGGVRLLIVREDDVLAYIEEGECDED